MLKHTNNASATLAGAITASATTVILTPGNGSLFPALGAGEFFYATLVDSANNLEIVKVTGRSADTLTVARAQDNTIARAYSVGDKFELRLVAAVFSELIQRDGSIAMTADLNHGGFKATNVADPAAPQDAATKNYVDTTAVAAVNAEAAARAAADSAEVTARNAAITAETNRAVAAEATKANTGGGNASGTWPISVSGSAGSVAWGGVTDRPTGEPWFGTVSNCGGVSGAGYNGTGITGGMYLYDEGGNVRIGGTVTLTACACACACSTCCFPLDTEVAMADGSVKPVQNVEAGDKVLSPFGDVVEVLSQIVCPVPEGETTYLVNETTRMTGEHLLRGESGWLAVDLQGYIGWREKQLSSGSDAGIDPSQIKQAKIGDMVLTLDGLVEIKSIERFSGEAPETLMSLELTGNRSFFANGLAVESKTNQE
jgi:hypothetical protein